MKKVCNQCGTVDGFVIVDGASVECFHRFHVEAELVEANDRIAELAQEVVALEKRNDDDLRILGRRNSYISLHEQYLSDRGLVDDYGKWLTEGVVKTQFTGFISNDLSGLAAREQGIEAAEIYLEKKNKKPLRGWTKSYNFS